MLKTKKPKYDTVADLGAQRLALEQLKMRWSTFTEILGPSDSESLASQDISRICTAAKGFRRNGQSV
jgi:hypothetical protein